jgi:hypothetical protein
MIQSESQRARLNFGQFEELAHVLCFIPLEKMSNNRRQTVKPLRLTAVGQKE